MDMAFRYGYGQCSQLMDTVLLLAVLFIAETVKYILIDIAVLSKKPISIWILFLYLLSFSSSCSLCLSNRKKNDSRKNY